MLFLTGNNLGKRQQELNEKVKEAVIGKLDFEEVKAADEVSDVDKLFKIDLASKLKNIDYIVEILKCGDSLCISRALKCLWIYNDEFSGLINTDYLDHNIFPYMSIKMKKKTLTSISIYVRNEERAASFFTYCLTIKMINIAFKFLIFSSESFKLDFIEKQIEMLHDFINQKKVYLEFFIGNSFTLADAYLKKSERVQNDVLHEFRYLYSVNDKKYLDLLEKYGVFKTNTRIRRFGLRISRNILKKHKNRVLKCPKLYVSKLNKNALVKFSTNNDAKMYAVGVLPEEVKNFWDMDYFRTYEHVFKLFSEKEKYEFIKNIFTNKYPGEPFEMDIKFYNLQMYKIMTEKEREDWALSHLATNKELLGSGQDYLWYKFVNFEKAFAEIKKYVTISSDLHIRGNIVNVLIECVRNLKELEQLLNYFYDRHINETLHVKIRFVDELLEHHNVYNFNENCWTVINKILCNINRHHSSPYHSIRYTTITAFCHIIHDKDLPEQSREIIDSNVSSYYFNDEVEKLNKVNKDKGEVLYKYLVKFYADIITSFDGKPYDDEIKEKARIYIHNVLSLMTVHEKSKEECPEIVMKYIKLDWDLFKKYKQFCEKTEVFSEQQMIRLLKQDAKLTVDKFPLMKQSINRYLRMNNLLRKLKIYFSNDLAKHFITFFEQMLLEDSDRLYEYHIIYIAVHGLFQLTNEQYKIDFMTKYSPVEPKIKHDEIDDQLLCIQESICRFAYYTRPPVPLAKMLMFVKGDYVKYCVPMFDSYLSNLPSPLCMEFLEATLDSPISIQKHSLRLAFKSFNIDNLKKLIFHIWKKTRNVSLRVIIYKALFNKILGEDCPSQVKLFDVLKTLNLDLHQDDHEDLFSLIVSDGIPKNFRGDYLKSGWKSISKFSDKATNLNRKTEVIKTITRNIHMIDEKFLKLIINNHINAVLVSDSEKMRSMNSKDEMNNLNRAKWELTASFIIFDCKHNPKKNFELVDLIMKKCFEMWDVVFEDVYIARKLWSQFLSDLVSKSFYCEGTSQLNPIFNNLLKHLQNTRPLREIYFTIWTLKLAMITRKIIDDGKTKLADDTENDKIVVIKEVAVKFAAEIVELLNDFTNKQRSFKTLFYAIEENIAENIKVITRALQMYRYSDHFLHDLHVYIALGLTDFKITEVYLLALTILPSECFETSKDEFEIVISRMKKFEDNEVQCTMYQKFVGGDFKRRRYV